MIPNKQMTKGELAILKEQIIREYKDSHEQSIRQEIAHSHFVTGMKKMIPYNIFIGLIISVFFVFVYGWGIYLRTVLGTIIVATIGSAMAGILLKK